MKLSDILDLDFALFNPEISYFGQWALNYDYQDDIHHDILYINAKNNGDKNMYEEFMEKHYYSKMKDILNSDAMAHNIKSEIMFDEDENGRITKFSMSMYIAKVLNSLRFSKYTNEDYIEFSKQSYEEQLSYFGDALRYERLCIKDVQRLGKQSEYYDKLYREFVDHGYSKLGTFDSYLESVISFCTKMLFGRRLFMNFFEKRIDTRELVNCFDFDKFALICCKAAMDDLIFSDKVHDCVSTSVYFLSYYFNAVDCLRGVNPNYNCKIKYYEDGILKTVDIDSLNLKFKGILQRHPEMRFKGINDVERFLRSHNVSDDEISNMNKRDLSRLVFHLSSFEETSEDEIQTEIQEIVVLSNQIQDPKEKNKLLQQKAKIEFLLENKPVKILKGKETFKNYYGYVYSNGYVVLDVINKDFQRSYGNGIYIMPLERLEDYSKEKKPILRSDDFQDVTYVPHIGDWKEKILEKLREVNISGTVIDEVSESIDISNITSLDELEKIKARLSNMDVDTKTKERKIQDMLHIDEELQKEECADDISLIENMQLNEEVDELLSGEKLEFDKLYKFWKEHKSGKTVKRNPVVAAITKDRAKDENGNYCCELCEATSFDSRSFDSHHMIPISNGGIDNIYNTVCLCPNCHRLIHSGKVTLNQQYELFQKIRMHLYKDNPEYLDKFDRMVDPNSETDDYYESHKDAYDRMFATSWNGYKIR